MLQRIFTPQAWVQVIWNPAAPWNRMGTSQFSSHFVGRAKNNPRNIQATMNPRV